MPQALPALAAVVTVASGIRSLSQPRAPKLPPPPPTLTFEEARAQAQRVLDPLFREHLQNALRAVDRSNIRRGFFGQLPGAALASSRAADVATRHAQAVGQLTADLQNMTAEQAAQHAALALQAQRQNLLADYQRWQGLGAALQGLDQIRELWPVYWGRWFGPQPDTDQTLANAQTLIGQGYGSTSIVPPVSPSTTFSNPYRIITP